MGIERTLVEAKIATFESPSAYLSFKTGITFRLTTVQMPYLALIVKKRIMSIKFHLYGPCHVLYEEVPVTISVLVSLNVTHIIQGLFS